VHALKLLGFTIISTSAVIHAYWSAHPPWCQDEIGNLIMIHHLSIPAQNPLHVAQTMVELFGGVLTKFGPYPNSFIAWSGDEYGTAIEVYPSGTEMFPDAGNGQANFRHNKATSGFVATHAALSVERSKEEILSLAQKQGWRAIELSRGSFHVIEFWIENRVMLELMTPSMTAGYLKATRFSG
jgi:hypothetical protein